MGAWGDGFFANDQGSDLLFDLRTGNPAELVGLALEEWERHRSGHQYVLAGVEVVAIACGVPDGGDPAELQPLVLGRISSVEVRALLRRSVEIVDAIRHDAEVHEMEQGNGAFWTKLANLADRLAQASRETS